MSDFSNRVRRIGGIGVALFAALVRAIPERELGEVCEAMADPLVEAITDILMASKRTAQRVAEKVAAQRGDIVDAIGGIPDLYARAGRSGLFDGRCVHAVFGIEGGRVVFGSARFSEEGCGWHVVNPWYQNCFVPMASITAFWWEEAPVFAEECEKGYDKWNKVYGALKEHGMSALGLDGFIGNVLAMDSDLTRESLSALAENRMDDWAELVRRSAKRQQ